MALLASCDKSDTYSPMQASVLHNGVLVSCVTPPENDLLLNEKFADKISIYGILSKKDIPFEIKKIKNDGVERCYLSFNADLPEMRSMKYDGDTIAKGISTVNLKINGQDIKLLCTFKYTRSIDSYYGNNSIFIENIECEGKNVIRKDNTMNSDIVLDFILDNGALYLK